MSDFIIWLYAHCIKPQIDAAPQGDYEFWLSLMDSGLDPNCREEFEKPLEFTAIHAFLLGLRTGERLSPFILR